MRFSIALAVMFLFLALVLSGCSSDGPAISPVDSSQMEMAADRGGGTGTFTLEAKYSFFRSYPGGNAIYLLRIEPGPDFTGDATVSVSSDRLIKTELTSTHLNAESPMTELVLDPSKQLDFGFYYVTVTVSNQTHQESVELEVEIYNWGILSMNHAVTARERFIDWLETEHPELGNFGGEKWQVYSHYPLMEVEHYTHLSDNWEFRVSCHVTWNPQDYYEAMWIRPRGQWDPIITAKFAWDEASQSQIIYETPVEDWHYYYGY